MNLKAPLKSRFEAIKDDEPVELKSNNMSIGNPQIRCLNMDLLRGHEGLDEVRLRNLKEEIESDGILKRPIVVDGETKAVLDGHHRIGALRMIGCTKIPVIFVNYRSPKIGVKDFPEGKEIPKAKVIEAALSGRLLPPKSTWHYLRFSEKVKHISHIQRRVDIPLEYLK